MDGQHLQIVRSAEDNAVVQNRAARNARIDKLSADDPIRASYRTKRLQDWSIEAQSGANSRREIKNQFIREDTTIDQKIAAFRKICQAEVKHKTNAETD